MTTNTEEKTTTEPAPSLEQILEHYPRDMVGYDEMWLEDGARVNPHWRRLMKDLTKLGDTELERRRTDARRLLRENGVTYHIYNDPKGQKRTWQLDPIPLVINSQDWGAISVGLKQRARLLDMILRDIYGPRRLIKEGLIPAELIYAQQGFLRACDQVQMKDLPQLLLYAADLARGPDGRMWVLGDRSQAPSGAGYALETRMAMTRVMAEEFRRTQVHRLSIFFRHLRSMLASLLPHRKDDPRVVILTPGPHNETYFEHAYLASYLGYSLVQGDDLTVRGGKVWMKSLDGLKQVDIIVRRVDDTFCDPLELREDSHLGVPGLLQAARLGNVIIANPLGSSILESPALMPFLPNIAKHWLGEEILLPSAATWWCGQQKERDYVLANLRDLVIKPVDRRGPSVFGSQLSEKQMQDLKSRILAEPHMYVGQQVLSCSTAPSLRNGKLVPRRVLLRTFLTAHQGDYDVMPGGLTRVAQDEDALFVTNQTGGLSKDTWIMADKPVHQASLWPSIRQMESLMTGEGVLPSRSGENLFWVGRYTERSEGLLRLIRTVLNKLADYDDYRDDSDQVVLNHLLEALTHFTWVYPGFTGEDAAEKLKRPRLHIMDMVLNREHRSSLIGTLNSLLQGAYNVRDLWSVDTWRVVDDIDENLQYLSSNKTRFSILQTELDSLLASLMAFNSQTQESMPHEHGWYLLNVGRRMERALQLICFIRTCFVQYAGEVPEHLMLEATLVNHESLITHRRRYRSVQHIFTVLDLMLLDTRHPRSLAYQVDEIMTLMEALPQPTPSHHLSREQRLILQASTEIKLAEVEKLANINDELGSRRALAKLLDNVERRLEKVSELLHQRYFTHTQSARQLAPTKLELPA
ncbi:MAG: circularly permuted type 2 ATP-grasp protein [Pseudomonadota bacterium]|nr:circularly permuted type 2 ATP-grasp protein [Pseudomonadota bacterium]